MEPAISTGWDWRGCEHVLDYIGGRDSLQDVTVLCRLDQRSIDHRVHIQPRYLLSTQTEGYPRRPWWCMSSDRGAAQEQTRVMGAPDALTSLPGTSRRQIHRKVFQEDVLHNPGCVNLGECTELVLVLHRVDCAGDTRICYSSDSNPHYGGNDETTSDDRQLAVSRRIHSTHTKLHCVANEVSNPALRSSQVAWRPVCLCTQHPVATNVHREVVCQRLSSSRLSISPPTVGSVHLNLRPCSRPAERF